MFVRCFSISFVFLLSSCDSTNHLPAEVEIGAAENSEERAVRSDGAVNGFVLSEESGYRISAGGDREEWITTTEYVIETDPNGKEVDFAYESGSPYSYLFNENGRVVRTTATGWWGVSRTHFTIQEDVVAQRNGIPYDLVYDHNIDGIVVSMRHDGADVAAEFTHNDAGQILTASYISSNGDEKYYSHYYNDIGQRVRTEESGNVIIYPSGQLEIYFEYEYDENGNNSIETEHLPSGDIVGQRNFEYTRSDKQIVNLRMRQLLYFDFWPW